MLRSAPNGRGQVRALPGRRLRRSDLGARLHHRDEIRERGQAPGQPPRAGARVLEQGSRLRAKRPRARLRRSMRIHPIRGLGTRAIPRGPADRLRPGRAPRSLHRPPFPRRRRAGLCGEARGGHDRGRIEARRALPRGPRRLPSSENARTPTIPMSSAATSSGTTSPRTRCNSLVAGSSTSGCDHSKRRCATRKPCASCASASSPNATRTAGRLTAITGGASPSHGRSCAQGSLPCRVSSPAMRRESDSCSCGAIPTFVLAI